jgi:UDP-glucose:(heptosyl)LPS alpha-1,3-glucosyltransferase
MFLEKRCFQKSKRIIANSGMVKQQIINTYNINSSKIDIVYNGIKSKEINYQKSFDNLSKDFLLKKDQTTLLYVGSGFKRKGVSEFLQIIAKLKMPNIKVFVVGKEKNIEYYQQLSIELKIDNQVVFTGPREDVDDFYTISDIFILPTHYEPFSNVVLEAMNFKNAVFTTRQNGASEILDDYYIMDRPDDVSIVTKITNLIENIDKLESIKKENRIKSKQFSIDRNLSETLKIVNEVIN